MGKANEAKQEKKSENYRGLHLLGLERSLALVDFIQNWQDSSIGGSTIKENIQWVNVAFYVILGHVYHTYVL